MRQRPRRWEARLAAAAAGAGFLLVLPSSPADASGAVVYVDKTMSTCSDGGSGTATTPYCTIGKGLAALQAGSTLYIGNGSYAEVVTPPVSGTSTAAITITAWPGKHPTVGGMGYGVYLSSRQYVTVSDLVISGTVAQGIYVSGGSNITIAGNEVTDAGKPIRGSIAQGIRLDKTSNDLVTGNYTHHNSDSGIYLGAGTTATTVSGNESSFNAEGYQRNANGINVVSAGNTIIGNTTHDNEDSGIQFYTGGNNNLASLNVTYNNGDHGIDDLNVTGGRLIGNTVFHNCTTGINVEGTSGNYVVKNNIAVDNAVYPAYDGISCSRRAGNIGIWDSAPPTTTVDHNLVWLSKPGTMYVFKSSYTSLAAMQAATNQETHGIQADPQFVGPSSGNFRLGAGSPAIDRGDSGVSGEQATDVLGNPRVDDPGTANSQAEGPRPYDDLGAYEFQGASTPPPPPSSPPTAQLSVSPQSGTAPLAVTANASGSTDPQGQALSYRFDFGDGSAAGPQPDATATHTFTAAGTYTVKVTVTDTAGLTDSASQVVGVDSGSPPTANPPGFVASIANNYSTSTKTSGYITVWRSEGVAAGDLAVLTVQLTATSPTGPVAGTDTAGNTYTTAADVSDGSGNRLLVLSGVVVRPLSAGDKITVTFPSATGYRLGGDEFTGVTSAGSPSAATGVTGSFSSGPASASAGDIVFGAVSIPSGTGNPTWSTGWMNLGSYAVGSRYLGRAYEAAPAAGGYTASGTASGSWLAAAVSLRP